MGSNSNADWEIREGIGILSVNNPPGNYLQEPEFIPLETVRSWTSSPTLKGILIQGKGKHFSAGGDLTHLFRMISEEVDLTARLSGGTALLEHLVTLDLPLVAAIHGVCFGAGLELALTCHIRVCAENSLLAFPETGHGLMPGLGGTVRLPGVIGTAHSLQMILSGNILNSEEARLIGLIDGIVPRQDLFTHTYQLLKKMTDSLPVPVIKSVVRSLRNASHLPAGEAIREETRMFCTLAKLEAERRKHKPDS